MANLQLNGMKLVGNTTKFRSRGFQAPVCVSNETSLQSNQQKRANMRTSSVENQKVVNSLAKTKHYESSQLPAITGRRTPLLSLLGASVMNLYKPSDAFAIQDGVKADVESIPEFSLEDFSAEDGWTEMDSGLLYKVLQVGEGDLKKGILDTVDHYQPFPFVTVQYTAYKPNGKAFASTYIDRRPWNYQVGVRNEAQDEFGAVMNMRVGERRQFVVPEELAFKRKLFGQPLPQGQEAVLVDVELLFLQPY